MTEDPRHGRNGRLQTTRGLELLGVTGFAIAQPLYDIIGRFPDFLVAHGLGLGEIVLLALLLSFAIPAAALLLEIVVGAISRRLASALHAGFVAAGIALVALQLTTRLEHLPAVATIVVCLAIGAFGSIAVHRISMVARFVRLLAVTALIFPLLFLFSGRMRDLTLAGDASGLSASRVERPVPIVILVLDELPLISLLDEHAEIDTALTPRLARFAETSTAFPLTASGASYTTVALPMMLTGRHPEKYVLAATYSKFPNSLFSLLAPHYEVDSFEAITQLCPPGVCSDEVGSIEKISALLPDISVLYLHLTLPPGLRAGLPSVEENWKNFGDELSLPEKNPLSDPEFLKEHGLKLLERTQQSTDDFSAFLSRISSDRPANTLYFFHLMLPHPIWRTLPSGKRYFEPSNFDYGVPRHWKNAWESIQGYQRHLLQVGFTDRLIGRFLDRLVEQGIYDDALVILIADHGASFRPGDSRRDTTTTNSAELMLVPFFVKLPGQTEKVVIDRPIELVDFLPTVADVIGAEIPWPVDGYSALDSPATVRSEYTNTYADGRQKRLRIADVVAVRDERLAYKHSLFDPGIGEEGLYRVGPNAELLGRNLSELQIDARPAALASWIENVERLQQVDLRAPILPTLISGGIMGPDALGRPMDLAIALNGTIRAVTTTFDDEPGTAFFMAMVPPSALVEGMNRPRVFRIDAREDSIQLQRIR